MIMMLMWQIMHRELRGGHEGQPLTPAALMEDGPTRVLHACSNAGSEGTKVIPAPMPTPASATHTSQYIWDPSSGYGVNIHVTLCCSLDATLRDMLAAFG